MSKADLWPEHTPEQSRAYCKVYRARKSGKLKIRCVVCGRMRPKKKIEAHHPNGYRNALDVRMLCVSCHRVEELYSLDK